MATLAELTTPLTRAEVETSIYAAIAARGAKTTNWKPGGVVRTIIVGTALVLSALSSLISQLARMGFLELSEGDWLTLVALYVYGVVRDEGSFATGTVTLNNAGGGIYSGLAGDLVFLNSTSGKTYRNTEPYAVAALETGVEVAVQAVEIGTDSNAAAGEIDDFESSPLPGVTVTNALAIVGTDRQEDPAVREDCAERTGALSPNGPADAYSYRAKKAVRADGSSIGVTRTRTVADGMGGVTLYVADADGSLVAGDVDILQALIESSVAPLAVTPTVVEASPVVFDITYELWLRDVSGFTTSTVEELVEERLFAWAAVQPIGGHRKTGETQGRLYVDAIESVIGGTRPTTETIDVEVTVPAAALDLAPDEVAVIGLITGTVHLSTGGVIG